MAGLLTEQQLLAREEAIQQAIDSLEGAWTDDPIERQAGEWLQKLLQRELCKVTDLRLDGRR